MLTDDVVTTMELILNKVDVSIFTFCFIWIKLVALELEFRNLSLTKDEN